MLSKGRGKGEFYKADMQDLYYEDENFRPIADKTISSFKKQREIVEKYVKEFSRVSNSNYNAFTVIGRDRTEQILKQYKNYVNNNK